MTHDRMPIRDPLDLEVLRISGEEPRFDAPMRGFLQTQRAELGAALERSGLLDATSLGRENAWLYRLTFRTKGLTRAQENGLPQVTECHDFALRFLPDYLRAANRFAMLLRIGPRDCPAFHPNIAPTGAVCVEIYSGEPLVAIALSLHDLIRGKLRNVRETDCLNPAACSFYRNHVERPLDDRPLFGFRAKMRLEKVST
jgi:hypothetical protein